MYRDSKARKEDNKRELRLISLQAFLAKEYERCLMYFVEERRCKPHIQGGMMDCLSKNLKSRRRIRKFRDTRKIFTYQFILQGQS